jgi:hypothetical protein
MLGNTFHNVKRPESGFNHFFKQMQETLKCTVSAMWYSALFAKIIVESFYSYVNKTLVFISENLNFLLLIKLF